MLARMIARMHPLIFYIVVLAAFAGLAVASEPMEPKIRGMALNVAALALMGSWIFAVWMVTLQAFDGAAVFGFHLGPRIALLAAALLSVGGAFLYAAVALYVMFAWRTAEGLVRTAERSTHVSILETTELFVLVAAPPIGVWLLRSRIRRAAQRGQVAAAERRAARRAAKLALRKA
jgi:hypothetical protein